MAQRIGQHQALAAFDELARIVAHRGPGGLRRVLHALRVEQPGCGAGFFPACSRLLTFKQLPTHCQVPPASPWAKYQCNALQGGKSSGESRHTHPVLRAYKRAFTTSTSGHLPRRRTSSSGFRCCRSRADKSELYCFRPVETASIFT